MALKHCKANCTELSITSRKPKAYACDKWKMICTPDIHELCLDERACTEPILLPSELSQKEKKQ